MVKEEDRDGLTDTHADMGTAMITDRDRTTDFEESLRIKDPLVEAEDSLTKAQMYPDPVWWEGPPIRTTKGAFTARKLDIL